jgi:hypothetical protein
MWRHDSAIDLVLDSLGVGAVREPFVPAAIVGTVDIGDGSP